MKSNLRNEIKSYIVRSGYTMQEVVDRLSEDYGWSDSVSNLSNDIIWGPRKSETLVGRGGAVK